MKEKEIIELARIELIAMYKRTGIENSNVLTIINEYLGIDGKETLLPIRGYEKDYLISDKGMVISIKNGGFRKLKINNQVKGSQITLCKNGVTKLKRVSRLVYENFVSKIPDNKKIRFKDRNKYNNNLQNLELIDLTTQERNEKTI